MFTFVLIPSNSDLLNSVIIFCICRIVQDQIAWLTAELNGLTNEEECGEALNASGGDVPSAARYIKLNKLLK